MIVPLLESALRDDLQAVDRVLRKSLSSDVALIRQVSEYIIRGGGKRLRPALLILAAQACGYRGKHHHTLAAVVEMIHTATLLHDDVVDESSLRRGHATANAMFGNAASVLVGDFLYSRAFQLIVTVENMRVLQILSNATNVIAEGEVLQLMNTGNPDLDEESYLEVIRRKTAKLFEAAAQLGAVLAGADVGIEDALARYGMHVGTAFQLIDDVLDYSGELAAIGKNLGDDLAEGKATLPLIRALRVGSADDVALIRAALSGEGLKDFEAVLAALTRTDALAYARHCAEADSASATAALAALPDSSAKRTLLELSAFAVTRNF
ncbi:MAG TPA: polyprenyl synthetase family protein [Casimicrobiaceae bacterium]|nr:polyprenyl synthetase family protein [Casimicrobiaceae bacterium]